MSSSRVHRDRPRSSSAAPKLEQPIFRRKRAQTSADHQHRVVGGFYQLGAEIGKGGFGTVFSALDLQNGKSVAIKQFKLYDIEKSELQAIESEISLLKKLNHDNIVKYYATIKTDDHLYIVLEYMENGSLSQFIKRFGNLSETLVAVYISQVLRGLAYLHQQGTLHRDIKGANILTTKDGLVKLADFGVALQTSDAQKSNSVVGTPYWMAPEVIEMAGCSAASDIWSVGCTVVELLTGKPPYFDLAPMAALFRIVQDDVPPLPPGISPALTDFITKCFKKEPRLRPGADELLRHPWISSIPQNKVQQSAEYVENVNAPLGDRNSVLKTIQLYGQGTSNLQKLELVAEKGEGDDDNEENWDDEFGLTSDPSTLSLPTDAPQTDSTLNYGNPQFQEMNPNSEKSEFQLSNEDASALEDLGWDEDEDGNITNGVSASGFLCGKDRLIKYKEDGGQGLLGLDSLELVVPTTSDMDFAAKLRNRLSNFGSPRNNAAEINDSIDDIFVELDFEQEVQIDGSAKLRARSLELLAMINTSMEDHVIISACEELHRILDQHPKQKAHILSNPGAIPSVMEVLELQQSNVVSPVLSLVNTIVVKNQKSLENMAMIGFLPLLVRLAKFHLEGGMEGSAYEVRLEAAKFVGHLCSNATLSLQMFVACGGVKVMVDMLRLDGTQSPKSACFVEVALKGISQVLTLQAIPKNDFCRLFVKAGLLHQLIRVFLYQLSVLSSQNDHYKDVINQANLVGDVLLLFSQGDVVVKEYMSEFYVLQAIIKALNLGLPEENEIYSLLTIKLLKCLRNLSMDPNTVDRLDRSGTIPTLVSLLGSTLLNVKAKEIQNIIIHAMFYICRINKGRQTQAAQAGIIPYLKDVASTKNPLKQFALPIICDMAHASSTARAQLWSSDGVTFFLTLLDDSYWQLDAMQSIVIWLSNDVNRMESVLLQHQNLSRIIRAFRSSQNSDFEGLLSPLLEMICKSVRLNQALGQSGFFISGLIERLSYPKAIVRKNLLQMIRSIFEASTDQRRFVTEYGLYPLIQELAQDDNMILVMEIANQILQGLNATIAISTSTNLVVS